MWEEDSCGRGQLHRFRYRLIMSTVTHHDADYPLSIFSKSLAISFGAIFIIFVLELVFSFFNFRFSAQSFTGLLKFSFFSFLLLAGASLLLSLVQGVLVSLLTFLSNRFSRYLGTFRSNLAVSFSACLITCPYLIYFSNKLFSGEGLSAHESIGLFRVLFPSVVALFFFSFFFVLLHVVYPRVRSFTKRQHLWLSSSTLILLVVLYKVNASFFVGQYLFIHHAAFLVMFLLAEVIAAGIILFLQAASPAFLQIFRWFSLLVFSMVILFMVIGFVGGGVLLDSKLLSNIFIHSHLGKQFVWIYGFRGERQLGSAELFEDYLKTRDQFVGDSQIPSFEGKNFIWILSDAVRADHLPMYGYGRNTSPNLQKLSNRSLLFLHNYTQGPNTTTSLAAQMTGQYTSSLKRNGGIDEVETVAEAFRNSGYSTWAVVQDFDVKVLKGKGKEGVAFDKVFSKKRNTAPNIVKRATSLIKQRTEDKPFFLFLFFYETHGPYNKHSEFDYGDKPVDDYDGEISFVDKHIGKLLNFVNEEGLQDDTVIAVSSDHGDELGQHGGWGHPWKVFNCLLHVPFIFHLPGIEPRTVNTPIQSIDLFPTVVKLMNLSSSSSFDGTSFHPYLLSDSAPYIPLVISEAEPRNAREVSMLSYPWKIIYHISDSYFSLYNLENDHLEKIDRIDSELAISADLKNHLLSWLSYRENQIDHPEASTEAVAKVLKSLRSFNDNALGSLDSLSNAEIDSADFDMLAKALESYCSPIVAEKLIDISRHDSEKWSTSLRGLHILARRADREIGKSITGNLYEESQTILEALSTDEALGFLYEAARTDNPHHFKPALQVIGLVRPTVLRKKLLGLYLKTEDPTKENELLQTLGKLGEPFVEDRLLSQYEEHIGNKKSLANLPGVVSYKSERSRGYLFAMLKKNPKYGYQIGMEIGKVRNPYMLPVLKKIYSSCKGKSSSSKMSFMRKTALLHYLSIVSIDSLSVEEKIALKNTIETDIELSQYAEVTKLLKSL